MLEATTHLTASLLNQDSKELLQKLPHLILWSLVRLQLYVENFNKMEYSCQILLTQYFSFYVFSYRQLI